MFVNILKSILHELLSQKWKKQDIGIMFIIFLISLCCIYFGVARKAGVSGFEARMYANFLYRYYSYIYEHYSNNFQELSTFSIVYDESDNYLQSVPSDIRKLYHSPNVYVDHKQQTLIIISWAKNDDYKEFSFAQGYGIHVDFKDNVLSHVKCN